MNKLDISLEQDDEILLTISVGTIHTAAKEVARQIDRTNQELIRLISTGMSAEHQKFQDMNRRLENLKAAQIELVNVEAKARLRKKETA